MQVVVAAGEYTTGSAWLSEEKLLEQARDMWKRLSDEQKGAYGEDYFEQALRSLEKYTKSAVSRTWQSLNFRSLLLNKHFVSTMEQRREKVAL